MAVEPLNEEKIKEMAGHIRVVMDGLAKIDENYLKAVNKMRKHKNFMYDQSKDVNPMWLAEETKMNQAEVDLMETLIVAIGKAKKLDILRVEANRALIKHTNKLGAIDPGSKE